MKKTLLALSVLGAFAGAAQAQSSITIYGLLDTSVGYANKGASKFSLNSGTLNGSRIGFKGQEDLGNGLKAVFQLETGFKSDTGALDSENTLFRRKAVVGLSGDFGTVLAGRQTDFIDDLSSMSSVSTFGGAVSNVGTGLARLQGSRVNNALRYDTANLAGFSASAIYGFGEKQGSNKDGQSWGAGAKYENGPLSVGAGYFQSNADGSDTQKYAPEGTQANQKQVKTFTLATGYAIGDSAKLFANWSRVKLPSAGGVVDGVRALGGAGNEKVDVYDLGGYYMVADNIKLMAGVQHSKAHFAGEGKGKLTQYNLGADYLLSKRTDFYTALSHLRASDMNNPGVIASDTLGTSNQTAVNVGIRHRF